MNDLMQGICQPNWFSIANSMCVLVNLIKIVGDCLIDIVGRWNILFTIENVSVIVFEFVTTLMLLYMAVPLNHV